MVNRCFCRGSRVSTSVRKSSTHVLAFEAQASPDASKRWEMLSLNEVLVFLNQMTDPPSLDSISCILQDRMETIDLENAKRLHVLIHKFGLDTHPIIPNYLVGMFVACGSLPDAYQLFQKLARPNEYIWTSLVQEFDNIQGVLLQSRAMHQDIQPLNRHVLQEMLKSCARLKSISEGQQLHFYVAKEGFDADHFVGAALVDMYAKCGSLVEARDVFESLPVRDVVLWTALIAGYAMHGLYMQALKFLEEMHLKGLSPNAVTYLCILKAFGNIETSEKGHKVHGEIVRCGFENDLYVGSTLVDLYAKCGLLSDAEAVFKKLPVRNVFSWNARITAYAENTLGEEVPGLLDQMELEGVSPDAVTYLCSLKGCGSAGDIERGQQVHIASAKQGLERAVTLGNSLVDMYAKCGFLAEAENIFTKLPDKNIVSWTALIAGYVEHGADKKALTYLDQMHLREIHQDAITFVGNLKAVSSCMDLRRGFEEHFKIIKEGFERDIFVCNSLIDFYAQSGLLLEARDVLEELPSRDVVSWNSLIAGLVEHEAAEEALICLQHIHMDQVFPDAVTLMCGLRACTSMDNVTSGQELHAEIAKEGLESDMYVGNTLIDMYAKCGSLIEALEVFDELPIRDVASWTARIAGLTDNGHGVEALNSFEDMQLKGVSPNVATYICCSKACGSIRAIRRCQTLHAEVTRKGFDLYPSLGSSLVDMYAKCNFLMDARAIFEVLSVRDDATYNALLWGYAERGHKVEAMECMEQMWIEGVVPDNVTFGSILKVCGSSRAASLGEEMHLEIVKRGLERDTFVSDNLVDFYAKCGLHAEARKMSNRLPVRDVVSWNTLISGYVEHGEGEEALSCLEQMQLEGLLPDQITYVSCLKACGIIGALDKGREIYGSIVQEELEEDFFICNTLVDMYAKCGLLSEAKELFDEMSHRDVVSWNVLVVGYSSQGESDAVFHSLKQMRKNGLAPNAATVLGILTASNHSGLTNECQQYFEVLNREHAWSLTIDHYNCMIDLLGRAGQLACMQGVVEQMPFQPNLVTWSSVLSSCRKLGYVDLGRWAFISAVSCSQKKASTFVMMANIYADNYC